MNISEKAQVSLVIAGAILAVLFIVLSRTSDRRRQKSALNELENRQPVTSGSQNITRAQAQQIAIQMHAAMKGWGTDEKALLGALKDLRTNADARAVDTAFGIQRNQSLGAWIESDGETSNVNRVLSEKGISYRFPMVDNRKWYEIG